MGIPGLRLFALFYDLPTLFAPDFAWLTGLPVLAVLSLLAFRRAVGAFRVRSRIRQALKAASTRRGRVRILCVGDSLTASSYPGHLELELRRHGADVEVLGLGFPGDTSKELLRRLERSIQVERLEPDQVVLLIGTNDSRVDFNHVSTPHFRLNLERVCGHLLVATSSRQVGPRLVLCAPPPVRPVRFHFSATSQRRLQVEIGPVVEEVGELLNLPVVDLHSVVPTTGLKPGDVHPTEEGYRAIALAVARVLESFSSYPQAGGESGESAPDVPDWTSSHGAVD